MAEPTQGVLDTSVLIDHDLIEAAMLPDESAATAIILAELARRQGRLLWATATWDPLPFDAESARRAVFTKTYANFHASPTAPGQASGRGPALLAGLALDPIARR